MPSKKKKYNARFPPARIKKIMQTDEDVGKVAAAVPVIISRALELFIDSLIEKTASVTRAKNAKTLSASHIKQAIHSEKTFDFLRDLVKNVPDHQTEEEADAVMPSGSGIVEKKIKVPRQRKPREEGSRGPGRPKEERARGPRKPKHEGERGPGRPRKVKVEEKRESSSDESDEETETDEEQTGEDDDQPVDQPCYSPQDNSQHLSQGYSAQRSVQAEAKGLRGFRIPGEPSQDANSMSGQGLASQVTMQRSMIGAEQHTSASHLENPPYPETSARVSNIEVVPSVMNPLLSQGQPTVSSVQQDLRAPLPQGQSNASPFPFPGMYQGYPMHNMMFPQYPFMPGGQQFSFLPTQAGIGSLPISTTVAGMGPLAAQAVSQFMPGTQGYMMPPMGPASPMMSFRPNLTGMTRMSTSLPAPISSQSNPEGETSMPLDMSVTGKKRSQTVPVQSQIPTPCGTVPFDASSPTVTTSSSKSLAGDSQYVLPQWGLNNKINQSLQETVSRSQIMGPSPVVSTSATQSNSPVTENGKHKQNDTSADSLTKKPKQRHYSDTSGQVKPVSFPGLANLMNLPQVKTKQDEDNDYDT